MTNQQTTDNTGRNRFIAVVLPWLLIGQFLWNLLTPAHEYPMRTEQVMTMTFDFFMVAGLFGLRASMPKPLFWIALIAGLGLFLLRLTGRRLVDRPSRLHDSAAVTALAHARHQFASRSITRSSKARNRASRLRSR